MKKVIISVIIILIAGGIGTYFYLNGKKYQAPNWKTVKIERGNISVNVTATGTLNAITTVQVGAQVSGIVAKIMVDFNSVVKKNQVIAVLDTVLLYATMKDAMASVEKSMAQAELMKRQFIRADTLFHQNVASQADYDLAMTNYKAAQADLMAAKATLEHEKINLKYTTIRAPINGTVISRNVDVGQTVISSFNAPTLFTIAKDMTQMQLFAFVDEADIGLVKVGQQAEFTVDAFPYEVFEGKAAQIRLQPTMIQNVNNYTVVINVANPDLKLLPGLTATTTIKTQQHDSVLKVLINAVHFTPPADYLAEEKFPDSTIQKINTKKIGGNEIPKPGNVCYIWILKNNTLVPEPVIAGLFDGTNLEISGNINDGDTVVTGISSVVTNVSTTANNPFMPQMRQQPKKK